MGQREKQEKKGKGEEEKEETTEPQEWEEEQGGGDGINFFSFILFSICFHTNKETRVQCGTETLTTTTTKNQYRSVHI